MFPASYQVPAAVILLGGGLLSCFIGHRLFRIVLGIYGFVAGALVTSAIMGPGEPQTTMISMLVGGLVGALILVLAYFVGVAIIGAALGAIVVHLIWAQLGREPHPLVVITGTVAGALGALALQRYVIIVATAFAGAWTALVGALAIAAGRSATTSDGWVIYPLRPPLGYEWMWIAWLALGAIGLVVQLATKPKPARRTT
jgi:Domain of unknown function (DUF4203)